MWNGFSKKIKSIIRSGKIYYLPSSYGNFYPICKKLIESGNKSLVLKKKIKCNFPIRLFHGLNDKIISADFSISLAKTLLSKDITLFFQKDADHSLSRKEDLKKISNELIRLIKNTI